MVTRFLAQRKPGHVQAIVAMFVSVLCGVSLGAVTPALSTDETPMRWATTNYQQIADKVLGGPTDFNTASPAAFRWVAIARIRPAYDNPESEVVLREAQDGHYSMRYCEAVDTSIFQQALRLRESHPEWDVAHIATLVHASCRESGPADHQRQLRLLAKQLDETRVSLLQPNVMISDPTAYHLWSLSGSQWIEMNLVGDERSVGAVIRWIEALKRQAKAVSR
jgi:hypothetical protein